MNTSPHGADEELSQLLAEMGRSERPTLREAAARAEQMGVPVPPELRDASQVADATVLLTDNGFHYLLVAASTICGASRRATSSVLCIGRYCRSEFSHIPARSIARSPPKGNRACLVWTVAESWGFEVARRAARRCGAALLHSLENAPAFPQLRALSGFNPRIRQQKPVSLGTRALRFGWRRAGDSNPRFLCNGGILGSRRAPSASRSALVSSANYTSVSSGLKTRMNFLLRIAQETECAGVLCSGLEVCALDHDILMVFP